MKRSWIAATAAWLTIFSLHADAAPKPKPSPKRPEYTVVELPAASGADFLQPLRINNRGEILGKLDFSTGPYLDNPHAAFYRRGETVDLHLLLPDQGIQNSVPVAMNDRGEMIFLAFGDQDGGGFFIYRKEQLKDLNALIGRTNISVHDINNGGTIVGSVLGETNEEAFSYRHGQIRMPGSYSNAPQSVAWAVNEPGTIVGWAGGIQDQADVAVQFTGKRVTLVAENERAIDINNRGDVLCLGLVRWKNGKVTTLPFDSAAINNRGEIVGSLNQYSNDSHAMLHAKQTTTDLNTLIDQDLGWRLINAYDINDRGQIVGWGRVAGHWSGFLLTPGGH